MTHRPRLLAAALAAVPAAAGWLVVAVPGAVARGANPSGAPGVEGFSEARVRAWEEQTHTTFGTSTVPFSSRDARYVRITGVTRGTSAGTSIEEAKTYGVDN
jgi:hypothetical protein